MIILLSPAKTFKKTNKLGIKNPHFYNKSLKLVNDLKKLSKDDLKKHLKLSDKLTNDVYNYYQNFNKTYNAFSLYDGAVFRNLDFDTITINKNNELIVLDALYGFITINDNISKYRLDFMQRYFKDLYSFWKEDISNYFKTNYKDKLIINLASNEFTKMFNDDIKFLTIDFKGVNKKISNMHLKQTRGLFARNIYENNYTLDTLKNIKLDGFSFDKNLSSENVYIFSK